MIHCFIHPKYLLQVVFRAYNPNNLPLALKITFYSTCYLKTLTSVENTFSVLSLFRRAHQVTAVQSLICHNLFIDIHAHPVVFPLNDLTSFVISGYLAQITRCLRKTTLLHSVLPILLLGH